jgi:hypothetical protein
LAEVVDPYLDPDTGLLRNVVGAATKSALDAAEADLVWPRAVQLLEHPVRATGDLDEFRAASPMTSAECSVRFRRPERFRQQVPQRNLQMSRCVDRLTSTEGSPSEPTTADSGPQRNCCDVRITGSRSSRRAGTSSSTSGVLADTAYQLLPV